MSEMFYKFFDPRLKHWLLVPASRYMLIRFENGNVGVYAIGHAEAYDKVEGLIGVRADHLQVGSGSTFVTPCRNGP